MGHGIARGMTAPALHMAGTFQIGGKQLFGPVDLNFPAAGWSCVLGPSGAGKSTILRLLLDLETGGTFHGTVTASDGAPLAERVAMMAQSDLLMPWLPVRENVVLGARLRGEAPDMARADKLIARVGLGDHASKKPAALSGGMRQRVALARTLMEDRPIVLLDEPFSALDASTRADMQELAAEVLKDKTVVLVTHDPAEAARLGRKIFVMEGGAVNVWPTPDTPPIRPINAPETLACQSALLDHLRGHVA